MVLETPAQYPTAEDGAATLRLLDEVIYDTAEFVYFEVLGANSAADIAVAASVLVVECKHALVRLLPVEN